jgi:hypothetical protein
MHVVPETIYHALYGRGSLIPPWILPSHCGADGGVETEVLERSAGLSVAGKSDPRVNLCLGLR